jgi:hypothetical protein
VQGGAIAVKNVMFLNLTVRYIGEESTKPDINFVLFLKEKGKGNVEPRTDHEGS